MTQQSRSWWANSHCVPTRCAYSPGKEIVRALTIYSKINKPPKIPKKLGRSNSSTRMLWRLNLKREAPVLPKCVVVYIRLWAPPFWAWFRTRFLCWVKWSVRDSHDGVWKNLVIHTKLRRKKTRRSAKKILKSWNCNRMLQKVNGFMWRKEGQPTSGQLKRRALRCYCNIYSAATNWSP